MAKRKKRTAQVGENEDENLTPNTAFDEESRVESDDDVENNESDFDQDDDAGEPDVNALLEQEDELADDFEVDTDSMITAGLTGDPVKLYLREIGQVGFSFKCNSAEDAKFPDSAISA